MGNFGLYIPIFLGRGCDCGVVPVRKAVTETDEKRSVPDTGPTVDGLSREVGKAVFLNEVRWSG